MVKGENKLSDFVWRKKAEERSESENEYQSVSVYGVLYSESLSWPGKESTHTQ